MKLLALDTSSPACSVALAVGDSCIERHEEQPREHTRILMRMIRAVLAEAGLSPGDLDAIVLGNGPGSFIGMRIATSVAQGLAFGAGLGIVPVSSMAAVAQEVLRESESASVVVAQDARMQQVYLGEYVRDGNGHAALVGAERIVDVAPIAGLDSNPPGPRTAAGEGWQRYPALLECNRETIDQCAAVLHPHARHLLELGRVQLMASGTVEPRAIEPAYLRQKVAEKPAS